SGRRSGAAWRGSASANCACASSATTPGCTNTSPSSSPAASAGWRASCGRIPRGVWGPPNAVFTTPGDALLMAVLGGAGTLVGGVIGAGIVFGLREYLSTLVPWWQYVLGAVYVLTILFLPTGLMGIPERIRQWRASPRKPEGAKQLASMPS